MKLTITATIDYKEDGYNYTEILDEVEFSDVLTRSYLKEEDNFKDRVAEMYEEFIMRSEFKEEGP